jgi:hypothetical protein
MTEHVTELSGPRALETPPSVSSGFAALETPPSGVTTKLGPVEGRVLALLLPTCSRLASLNLAHNELDAGACRQLRVAWDAAGKAAEGLDLSLQVVSRWRHGSAARRPPRAVADIVAKLKADLEVQTFGLRWMRLAGAEWLSGVAPPPPPSGRRLNNLLDARALAEVSIALDERCELSHSQLHALQVAMAQGGPPVALLQYDYIEVRDGKAVSYFRPAHESPLDVLMIVCAHCGIDATGGLHQVADACWRVVYDVGGEWEPDPLMNEANLDFRLARPSLGLSI